MYPQKVWLEAEKKQTKIISLSYAMECEPTDEDAIFLERTILREKNPELKEALEDLDEFLFG